MDLAKLPNRGIYYPPRWTRDIKLHRTEGGELALAYPKYKTKANFLKIIHSVPAWEPTHGVDEQDLLLDDGEHHLDPVLPQESVPAMDPDTPTHKRAAVVKIDPDKNPFDFMSNRPVPRVKPVAAEELAEVEEAVQPSVQPIVPGPPRLAELMAAFEASQSAISNLRCSVIEHRAQRLSDDIAALSTATRPTKSSATAHGEQVKWRHVPINDADVKFAVRFLLTPSYSTRTKANPAIQTTSPAHQYPYIRPTPFIFQNSG